MSRTARSRSRAQNPAEPKSWTLDDFWKLADISRMTAEYKMDKDLLYLRSAPLDQLRAVFVQYRYFTVFYIQDLAYLIARIRPGTLRSSLAHFLSEELGDMEPANAHPELYDSFLRSVGVADLAHTQPNGRNMGLLKSIQKEVIEKSPAYAIGLRGMGGECLCQIYLAAMHENFIQNPHIQQIEDKIDWRFWDIHTGDADIEHRDKTRAAIDEYLRQHPDEIPDLASGYEKSKAAWDAFWSNIFYESSRPSIAIIKR